MSDTIIFFIPKDRTYSLNDVVDTLECVYGNITRTTIWNDEPSKIWYSVEINWKRTNDEIKDLKSKLYDNNALISVSHKVDNNHSYCYDVEIFSYKIWYYYTYQQQYNILNEKINYLESENMKLKFTLV